MEGSNFDARAKTCEQRSGFPLMALCPLIVLYSENSYSALPVSGAGLLCLSSLLRVTIPSNVLALFTHLQKEISCLQGEEVLAQSCSSAAPR